MNKRLLAIVMISMTGLTMVGCSFEFSTDTTAKNKPSNTASNAVSNTNAAKPASTTATKTEAPKPALKDEKKPTASDSKRASKNNPVPDSWIDVYDETKGYSFSVPEGTTGGSDTKEGVDVFIAKTPAPSEIGIIVLAFNDKTLTKTDLINKAKEFIEAMSEGAGTATMSAPRAESEEYSIVDAAIKVDGKTNKARVLVGTDVTDNYIMILVSEDEAKFAANEKVIDEIWGSFEIWSSSGNS